MLVRRAVTTLCLSAALLLVGVLPVLADDDGPGISVGDGGGNDNGGLPPSVDWEMWKDN